jgi:hypothetical protein
MGGTDGNCIDETSARRDTFITLKNTNGFLSRSANGLKYSEI